LETTNNISETVQDRNMIAMADQ